jgi:choice-of-anchor C domain-containing protein
MNRPRTFASLAALAVCLAWAPAAQANLIVNGSFETPTAPPNGFSVLAGAALTGWTISGGTIDLINNGYWPAYDGLQSVDLSGTPGPIGTNISQTFATVPGQAYLLTFAYANNADFPPLTATADVEVTGLGTLLSESITHSNSTRANMDYLIFSGTFVADSTSATLSFTHTGSTGIDNFQGIVLDAVSVTQVPEPTSLAVLGLAGLASAGYVSRRHRRP